MKLRLSLASLLFALVFCSFYILPDRFTALLNRAGLSFTEPEGWTETPVISNNKMHYEYAITNAAKTVEIRYTIRPIDSLLIRYQEMKQKGGTIVHPNNYFKPALMATLMNISSGARAPQMKPYDSLAVKKEYGADKGITAVTMPAPAFAQNYKFCMVSAIQKDNIGYAYIFVLFNDQQDIKALPMTVWYALKFKP